MTDLLNESREEERQPLVKPCTRCQAKPRRAVGQRWCHECHADYVRFRREAQVERAASIDYPQRARVGIFSGIYFIWCYGFVKAGQSCDIVGRLRQIQCSNPRTAFPLGYISEHNMARLDELEHSVLCALDPDLYRGEWFRCTRTVLDYIAANTRDWPREAA